MTLKEAIQLAGGLDEAKTYAIMVDARKKGWEFVILLDDYKRKPELGSILIHRTWSIWAVSKNCYEVYTKQLAEPHASSNSLAPKALGAGGY
jgi:hypothetical protein